jgi:hypothetical protein
MPEIYFKEFQPSFPLRSPQRLTADTFEIGHVFTGPTAGRAPGISRRRRFQINCAYFSRSVLQPIVQGALAAVTSVKNFRRLHFSSARPGLVDRQLFFQLMPLRLPCRTLRRTASYFELPRRRQFVAGARECFVNMRSDCGEIRWAGRGDCPWGPRSGREGVYRRAMGRLGIEQMAMPTAE